MRQARKRGAGVIGEGCWRRGRENTLCVGGWGEEVLIESVHDLHSRGFMPYGRVSHHLV